MALILRIAVALLAAGGVAAGLHWHSDASACLIDQRVVLKAANNREADTAAISRLERHCSDPGGLAIVAAGLARVDPAQSERLALTIIHRAPENFRGWAALAFARADRPAEARSAVLKAKQLNPRWHVPEALRVARTPRP